MSTWTWYAIGILLFLIICYVLYKYFGVYNTIKSETPKPEMKIQLSTPDSDSEVELSDSEVSEVDSLQERLDTANTLFSEGKVDQAMDIYNEFNVKEPEMKPAALQHLIPTKDWRRVGQISRFVHSEIQRAQETPELAMDILKAARQVFLTDYSEFTLPEAFETLNITV